MTPSTSTAKKASILLTGGAGFLGRSIIRELLDPACPFQPEKIMVYDLEEPAGFSDDRLHFIRGDVRDSALLEKSCLGVDLVIHSAAIVDWGTRTEADIMDVNFGGTENVLKACIAQNVKGLVYTSSLDVLFNGQDLTGVDENMPYPEQHASYYCVSKTRAEKLVLAANSASLTTCALRPSDIYGGGDPYHIGSLIGMAKGGFYVRLGNGRALSQHVYVGNIAHAHVLAAATILEGKTAVAGNPYFITDGEASNFFSFFDEIIEAIGYKIWPRNLWLPRGFALSIGSLSELLAWLLRPVKKYTPKMSRFAVIYTCTNYTFSSEKARKDFGFVPKYSKEEALGQTVAFYRDTGKNRVST